MSAATDSAQQEAQWRKWRSVADLYHAFFTGLILTVVTRRGTADAAEFVFRVFRRQQQERFLPGLKKLGLDGLPPAVAAAQYHYLSNWIGGVHVEYMHETDRKAWIRYPPPRWIWKGTAICGVPGEVSRAMLRGWHANNGVALGDLRLGFVCTKQSVDGQDGLEGYYCEYDHPLELDQRLVFARHLEAPLFDPNTAPALPVDSWPKPRLEKAYRNYAMEYVKTAAPVIVQVFGPEDASYLLHLTGRLIGMQYYDEVAQALGGSRGRATEFAAFLRTLFESQDDVADITESEGQFEIRQQGWKLMADVADYHPACASVLTGLFEGLAAGCGRHIPVYLKPNSTAGAPFVWSIG
ncbi:MULTISPECIES: hypothetical protein [Bradyrhizobium]|uniref:Uncharacterized protein n=1 Tax=Bradyrhizobium elkanii TaxID=29448 RepID=A0A8I1Y6T0_BRAEL|nr:MULTISPECIES: hypothetical protein [Bradyrhizobium]MBP1293054.1 hypothetical protein [Bradyrhizobium elkanii]MCP1926443.1 hypothetical protein [Bradyrhizobium elkanii]MCS3476032.1 hypothetical protein [Bradyrhizobium elkanii]MCS3582881.1 hypothetical protein [Bradyrhizobium elkanii]MCS3716449.1 hypothetical protein [Bradyrhizobium elkanii]